MPENTLKTAGTLSARASKSLDAMRTHVTRRVPTPRTRHEPPKSSTPPRLFAPARKRGSLNLCRDPDVVATQDTVGPYILTVCSTPSRRVALLRPRYAGLTALTASPRTRHDTALDRRCSTTTRATSWPGRCGRRCKRPM